MSAVPKKEKGAKPKVKKKTKAGKVAGRIGKAASKRAKSVGKAASKGAKAATKGAKAARDAASKGAKAVVKGFGSAKNRLKIAYYTKRREGKEKSISKLKKKISTKAKVGLQQLKNRKPQSYDLDLATAKDLKSLGTILDNFRKNKTHKKLKDIAAKRKGIESDCKELKKLGKPCEEVAKKAGGKKPPKLKF